MCGGKNWCFRIKKFKDYKRYPISKIIGTISDENKPTLDGYGDIHRDEDGVYCFYIIQEIHAKKILLKI